jgi:hypothetical protein
LNKSAIKIPQNSPPPQSRPKILSKRVVVVKTKLELLSPNPTLQLQGSKTDPNVSRVSRRFIAIAQRDHKNRRTMEFVRLLGICNKQKSGILHCVSLAHAAAAAVVVALYCCFPFRWVLWKQSLSSTGFLPLLFGSERARGRIFRGALWRNKSYNRMSSSFTEPYLQPNVQ